MERNIPLQPASVANMRRPSRLVRRTGRLAAWAVVVAASTATGCSEWQAPEPVDFKTEEWTYHGVAGSKLTSEHYVIYTTCKNKGFVNALPTFLESCWDGYAALLSVEKPLTEPLPTYFFGTRWQWDRFTEEFTGPRAATYKKIRSGGFSERGVTISHYASQRASLSILAHEGLHQFLEVTRGRNIPAWLNEGLACYFESFDVDSAGGARFTPERNTLRTPALREALAAKSLIPLREILATNAGVVVHQTSTQVQTYYAMEWALVLFLNRNSQRNLYRDAFRQLLDELGTDAMDRKARAYLAADTDARMSSGEAVFRAYITEDIDGFEKQFHAYLYDLLGMKPPDK
jgi:hypothetical protein